MKLLPADDLDVIFSFSGRPRGFPSVPARPDRILPARLPLLIVGQKAMVASWDLRLVLHGSVASCI